MQFSVQRKQLKAMGRFMAVKDIRYYLQGIQVVQNNRGTYIESTNGHMLGRLLIDETPCAVECSVLVPSDAVKTLSASGKKGNETLHFTIDGVKISVISPDGSSMTVQAHEARYPDCDRVVPELSADCPNECSTYNPEYIMAFYDCAKDLGSSGKGTAVQIKQRGNQSGIVIIDSEPLFVGIIMPMREINTVTIPAWCTRAKTLETVTA
jgi:DNA polymerase III sliding clamp (beta) subunit (PCNA family)